MRPRQAARFRDCSSAILQWTRSLAEYWAARQRPPLPKKFIAAPSMRSRALAALDPGAGHIRRCVEEFPVPPAIDTRIEARGGECRPSPFGESETPGRRLSVLQLKKTNWPVASRLFC